jgi:V/A-type H+-transporting ATPase subunit A
MAEESHGKIYGINGPVIKVHGEYAFKMREMVLVGHDRLIGEVIRVLDTEVIVQVYENTTGLKPGEPDISTGKPLTVKLGPGIIGNIFDGIERPLTRIAENTGNFIKRGSVMDNLDSDKLWDVRLLAQNGQTVKPGTIFAEVKETESVIHKIMVHPDIEGEIIEEIGRYTPQRADQSAPQSHPPGPPWKPRLRCHRLRTQRPHAEPCRTPTR